MLEQGARQALPITRSQWVAVLLLAVGALALHWWPVLAQGHDIYLRDVLLFAAPVKHYWLQRVSAGELPLWAPYLAAGMPYLADAANQALYPANLLLFLPSPDIFRSVDWFLLAHALAAPASLFLLCRRLGTSVLAAGFAGVTFGLSGYVLSVCDNVNYLPAAAWAPALIAALLAGRGRPLAGPALATAAGCLALLVLAGDPVDGLIAVAVFAALVVASGEGRTAMLSAGGLALVTCVLAALVAAAQILPTEELLALSVRKGGLHLADAVTYSMPPHRAIELVQPYFFGAPAYGEDGLAATLYPVRHTPWAQSIYLGLVPVALALLGGAVRPRRGLPLLAVALVALVLAAGWHTGAIAWLRDLAPGVSAFRYPEKLVFWATLALCAGAGLGLDAVRDGGILPRSGAVRVALLVALAALLVVLLLVLPARGWLGGQQNELSHYWSSRLGHVVSHGQGLLIHLLAVVVVATAALALPPGSRLAPWVLACLAIGDLLLVHRGLPATSSAPWATEAARGARALRGTMASLGLGDTRIYYDVMVKDDLLQTDIAASLSTPQALARGKGTQTWELLSTFRVRRQKPLVGALAGLRYLNGSWSPLHSRAHELLQGRDLRRAPHETLARTSTGLVISPLVPRNPLWYRDGFRTVLTNERENYRVFEVQGVYPRAHWAEDPHAGGIEVRHDAPERIVVAVPAEHRPDLVTVTVTESRFPGWHALVDGHPAKLTDTHFLSVKVPPGRHVVEFRYRPTTALLAGGALSGVGLLALLATMLAPRLATRLRRRSAGGARAEGPGTRS